MGWSPQKPSGPLQKEGKDEKKTQTVKLDNKDGQEWYKNSAKLGELAVILKHKWGEEGWEPEILTK